MKLLKLLEKLEYECIRGSADVEVTGIEYDSRKKIEKDSLFVCIEGTCLHS